MTKKHINILLYSLMLTLTSVAAFGQNDPLQPSHASAQFDADEHFHGGSSVDFKMKLNEPLPAGARIEIQLSPADTPQTLSVSSTETTNPEHTEVLFHLKLPTDAPGGAWHISQTFLVFDGFLSHAVISTNPVTFQVEGRQGKLPTQGTVDFLPNKR